MFNYFRVACVAICATCLCFGVAQESQTLTKSVADQLYSPRGRSDWMKYTVPPNWTYLNPPFPIYANPLGEFMADIHPEAMKPANYSSFPRFFVDPIAGADSNAGIRRDAPFRSLTRALSIPGNKWVLCRPTLYDFTTGWRGAMPTGDVLIEPWDDSGPVISSGQFINLSWTQIAPGTFRARCSTYPDNVIDETTKDQWGNGRRYQKLSSVTAVTNTPGSYFVEGKYITVHPLSNQYPDQNLTVYSAQANGRYMANGHLFVRNFEFRGGSKPFASIATQPGQRVMFADCTFRYSLEGQDGFCMEGPGLTVTLRCKATGNFNDGFDYIYDRQFMEVDNIGSGNGVSTTELDNGTTCHHGCHGIVVNGLYADNKGRNVHNVYDSKVLMIGSQLGFSRGAGAANADLVSGAEAEDDTEIWAIQLKFLGGSTYARSTNGTARIWSRRHDATAPDIEALTGSIRPI
jgi:hypothetical protein